MKFEIENIKNFGVIKENKDKIVLNDLTIFMGDNSAGKSYLAILFNLLTRIEKELNLNVSMLENKKVYLKVLEILENLEDGEVEISLFKNEIYELKDILEIVIESFLKKHFKKLITKNFDLKINYYEVNEIKCILRKSQSDSLFEFVIVFEEEIEKDKKRGLENKFVLEKGKFNLHILIERFFETLFVFLVKSSLNIPTSIYLPAARTGYLHTAPILLEYAVKQSFSFNKEGSSVELPEWIRRFILELTVPASSVREDDVATLIEEEILKGEVKVYENDSRIEFYVGKKRIDIPYTSSSISELIPLVVFLKKGKIHKGSLLIIEEPEAHLSFENQRKIARIVAMLVNKGVKVLVTTHSDFFIYELNNLILAKDIEEEKKPNIYKNISLDYKKINIYNFLFKNKSKKSVIEQVPVKKDGIDNRYITNNLLARSEDLKMLYNLMEK
ncbi:MAG: AAA family ATPase [Nautiliaceae bacterium]